MRWLGFESNYRELFKWFVLLVIQNCVSSLPTDDGLQNGPGQHRNLQGTPTVSKVLFMVEMRLLKRSYNALRIQQRQGKIPLFKDVF